MKCSRTHEVRQIQFHAPGLKFDGATALQNAIVRYVCGTEGRPKVKPVSEYRVADYFRSTDPKFVREQLMVCHKAGRIKGRARGLRTGGVAWTFRAPVERTQQ
jgi:hypothetical protein